MIKLRSSVPIKRYFHITPTRLNTPNTTNTKKYEFYDKEVTSDQPPMAQDKDVVNSLTFDTNTPSSRKMELTDIFGVTGKKQTVSSRMDLSYRSLNKIICGVEVPKKPIAPTNCCGSGCVNCVWVIYDDDLEEWKELTKDAMNLLMSQDTSGKFEKWPLWFDPPPKGLDPKFIPDELKQKEEREEVDNVMPVQFSVFTNFERNLKLKKTHPTDLSQVGVKTLEKTI